MTRFLGLDVSSTSVKGVRVEDGKVIGAASRPRLRTLADDRLLQEVEAVIPAGRMGEPEEVAALAVFLASDEAAYVSGATYVIDGGMSHWNKGL